MTLPRGAAALLMAGWLVVTGCGGPPSWIRTTAPEDGQYFYAVGIHTGSSLGEAKRAAAYQALETLLERFGIQAQTRYHELRTELRTKVSDEVRAESGRVNLKEHLIMKWDYVSRRTEHGQMYDVFVLLRYPKAEWARERARLEQQEAERRLAAQQAFRRGRAMAESGDLLGAVAVLASVIQTARGSDEGDAQRALYELTGLLQQIDIQAISGSGQTATFPKGPAQPLVARVTLRWSNQQIALRSLPVRFQMVEPQGLVAGEIKTDSNGQARWVVTRLPNFAGQYVVRASVDPSGLQGILQPALEEKLGQVWVLTEVLGSREAEFRFSATSTRRETQVLVTIAEEHAGRAVVPPVVEAQVAQRMSLAGYDVLTTPPKGPADLLITGSCTTRPGTQNFGVAVSVWAEGDVRAVDQRTGRVLVRVRREAVGFGENAGTAGLKALKAMSEPLAAALVDELSEANTVGAVNLRQEHLKER